MQTIGANSKHKHSKMERFWTLNDRVSQNSIIVMSISSVTCTDQSL